MTKRQGVKFTKVVSVCEEDGEDKIKSAKLHAIDIG